MDRTVVHDWLRSILTPYADPQRTFADVTSLLDGYPSLSPRTDLYISNLGQSSLLLQLYGTLPIQYRNATYNIPVQIWVTRAYPREPPIAFVTPTNTMLVRKTEDVELDGEVQTEYAKQWTRKWETKNLVAYTQAAQEAFSRQPPVYAKPAASAATSSSSASSSVARASPGPSSASRSSPAPAATPAPGGGKPPPPLPGQATPSSSSSPTPQDGPPQRPPKPHQQPERSNTSPLHSPVVGGGGAFHATPALPPHRQHQYGPHRAASLDLTNRGGYAAPQHAQHPHAYGHGHTQSFSQQQQQPHHAQSPLAAPPPQGWQSPQPPHGQGHGSFSQAYQQQQQPPYPHQDQGSSSSSAMHPSYGPQQPQSNGHASPTPSAAQPPRPPPLPPAQYAAGPGAGPTPMPAVPTPPAKPRDLLAEDEDDTAARNEGAPGPSQQTTSATATAAPPLPPNPHLQSLHATLHARLTHRVSEIRVHLAQRNESLHHLATDLSSAPARIEDETARLSVVRDLCLHNATTWETALKAAKARRDDLSHRATTRDSDPSAERDFVVADSIVGEQLVGLVAQDMALTDVLYHLARAQEMGSAGLGNDLERYLKWVRGLARDQFLKRGLAGKIGRGLEGME